MSTDRACPTTSVSRRVSHRVATASVNDAPYVECRPPLTATGAAVAVNVAVTRSGRGGCSTRCVAGMRPIARRHELGCRQGSCIENEHRSTPCSIHGDALT